MDILYYSNHCKHCQKVIQYIVKNNLLDNINCICIDKRVRDVNNNQLYIILENGNKIIMPPNVHSVPTVLCVKKNHSVILGDSIIEYLKVSMPNTMHSQSDILQKNEEPMEYGCNLFGLTQNSNVSSGQYSNYSDTGSGSAMGDYHNYVSPDKSMAISTPPDNYRPDKLSNEVTTEGLQFKRNLDVGQKIPPISSQLPL
jgi:hypothetical protein